MLRNLNLNKYLQTSTPKLTAIFHSDCLQRSIPCFSCTADCTPKRLLFHIRCAIKCKTDTVCNDKWQRALSTRDVIRSNKLSHNNVLRRLMIKPRRCQNSQLHDRSSSRNVATRQTILTSTLIRQAVMATLVFLSQWRRQTILTKGLSWFLCAQLIVIDLEAI